MLFNSVGPHRLIQRKSCSNPFRSIRSASRTNPLKFPHMTSIDPKSISLFKKVRYLHSLSEDDFRDKVVRTLFLRQGLKDGRDFCGPTEEGKDALFYDVDSLGFKNFYAIQTKKGSLNLSRKHNENVITAITQLKTAAETAVPLLDPKEKIFPSKVILCCSGKINRNAREHIVNEVKDPRIMFMDADDLVCRIDEFFPEVWLGIDTDLVPYLHNVCQAIESNHHEELIADIEPTATLSDSAADNTFVPLTLNRTVIKFKMVNGKATPEPDIEEFPVTAVIERDDRVIFIYGDAGSGKTTALRRIAYILAKKGLSTDRDFLIPIQIRASEITVDTPAAFIVLMLNAANRVTKMDRPCFSNDDLENGNIVLLIDGLDEVGEDAGKRAIIATILNFHKSYPKNQIIITSRESLEIRKIEAIEHLPTFTVSPITSKQAERILKRFEKSRSLTAEKSKEILRRLEDVHGMALNPLLVTVFAATSDYSRRDIPANITELFKKYTEMMLGRWNANKSIGQQYHAPLKDFLLCKIAFEMHRSKKSSLPLKLFKSRIEEELTNRGHSAETDQLTDEIIVRSGLLRVVGDSIEFRHFMLQEFFAGRGISSREQIQYLVINNWWTTALVFYFGENPGNSEAFFQIQKSLEPVTGAPLFHAAIAVGLSLQACYLLQLTDKVKIYPWVIERIAGAKKPFLDATDAQKKYPLNRFLDYFFASRDSVAGSFVKEKFDELKGKILESGDSRELSDAKRFWLIIALLESGFMEDAFKEASDFSPVDQRLLLGINLSCFVIMNLRVTEKGDRIWADKIVRLLEKQIGHLRRELREEWKSEILELRRGEIRAIEPPKT